MATYRAIDPPSGRLIFIGDIHGCFVELEELLGRIAPGPGDVVVSVGDIVNKGPHPARCLDLWRERAYLAVRGNNEIKLLHGAKRFFRLFSRDPVLRRKDLIRFIESWPLVIDIPAAGVSAVHGGFLPDMDVTPDSVDESSDVLPELRWIRKKNGSWRAVPKEKKRKSDVLWAEVWSGNRLVVYGHTPLRAPRFDRRALGLDTGCVYGGQLTAAILSGGEWTTESVDARSKYAE